MTSGTATQQRSSVSAGVALGLVLCNRTTIPFEKWWVDLAFAGASRAWAHRTRFPQVNTDINKGLDGTRAMVRADEKKQVWPLYWDNAGTQLTTYSRAGGWDPNDDEDLHSAIGRLDGDVPLDGWVALAADFLARFDR
jgi:hypothetical protein